MPNVVIYARYSSHNQHETSIEGQLNECYAYCERNGYTLVKEYIDRALSGTNDNRPEFLQMIKDAASGQFEYVIVYQLDRFARNRHDSAIYKAKLKKYGVRVLSARENISEDASGILIESVLEGMAEYYSAELAQKIRRGMDLNGKKCLCTGGNIALGYKVDKDKKFIIDEETAPIVREIFERYANGETITAINDSLNNRGFKTSRGGEFNKCSLSRLLRNRRYIGIYTYKDTEIPDGMPRIISNDLFERVQNRLEQNKKAPAKGKAKIEYLLTTKLFCGHCNGMMHGYCGTSKTGKKYYYYTCKGTVAKKCKKKNVNKDYIEDIVVRECRAALTSDNISKIAKSVVEQNKKDIKSSKLAYLEKLLAGVVRKQKNLMEAILECDNNVIRKQLYEEAPKLEEDKKQYELAIAREKLSNITLTIEQVEFFLKELASGEIDDLEYRKALIAVLINRVFIYDDDDGVRNSKIMIIFNAANANVEVSVDDLAFIEKKSEEQKSSFMVADAPPS